MLLAVGALCGCLSSPAYLAKDLRDEVIGGGADYVAPIDSGLGSTAMAEVTETPSESMAIGAVTDATWTTALRPVAPVEYAPSPLALTSEPDREGDRSGDRYFMVKGGWIGQDDKDLGNGYVVNLAAGTFVIGRILALEIEGGWAETKKDKTNVDALVIPVMANARASIPLWILEIYGGAGIGGVYYDFDLSPAGDRDGWVVGGNLFAGADLVLFESLTGGVEVKYYVTDETRVTKDDLNGLAAMITLGLRF